MMEEWKTVEGYSRYKVSPNGEVLDTKTGKLVAKQLTGIPQYYYVNVNRDDGKRKLERVHRFVAMVYVEGRLTESDMVDHIDRNKLNNCFTNLRWVSRSENARNTKTNAYIEYDGSYCLLIDLVFSIFGEDKRLYQGVYQNIFIYGLPFDEAVDRWLLRKKRK